MKKGLFLLGMMGSYAYATEGDLVIFATTDLHSNVLSYDYYKDAPVEHYGFSKVYTALEELRAKYPISLLVDNGDTFQGNPLSDYFAQVLSRSQNHPMLKAMNEAKYDAMVLGNHEFNYGLDFLNKIEKKAHFPLVNGNIFWADQKQGRKPLVKSFVIVDRKIEGKNIRIGITGFTPPQIMNWDGRHLAGKIETKDILDSAKDVVSRMKKAGADLVLVLSHGGIFEEEYKPMSEAGTVALASLKDVDVLIAGHSHSVFPGKSFEKSKEPISNEKGTIHGKPSVQAGFWGSHLGMIQLRVKLDGKKWKIVDHKTEAIEVKSKKSHISIEKLVQKDHEEVLSYIRKPIGKTNAPITSFFSRLFDTPAVELINKAQKLFVEKELKGTQYESFPVLSAAAPFMTGFKDPKGYTNIPQGEFAIKHSADLYLYPNTVAAVLIEGDTVKKWLEKSAENFNQVDPQKEGSFELINENFKGYNFDVIDGVSYRIDLSKPVGERVVDFMFEGKPVEKNQKFVVASNNYRAFGGGHFPGVDASVVILNSTVENREVLVEYIKNQKNVDVQVDHNWGFKALENVKGTWYYTTGEEAKTYKEECLKVHSSENGWTKFQFDFVKCAR